MRFLASLVLLAASASTLPAASITLVSQSGGTYNYGLTTNAGEFVTFLQNQSIQLTGLSGVTSAVGQSSFSPYSTSSTSTTATFTQSSFLSSTFGGGGTITNLQVISSVLTTGLVNYTINTNNGPITGQVLGPAAAVTAVPEPSTYALLSGGLAALWVVRRRHRV